MDQNDLELLRHVIDTAITGEVDVEQAMQALETINAELTGEEDAEVSDSAEEVQDSTDDAGAEAAAELA